MQDGLFAGDLDEVDFIEEVERRFGVAFDEGDYQGWLTLGDIHASLIKRLGKIEGQGGHCASQMAFYRLRRAAGFANAQARPETRLDMLGLGHPARTLRALRRCNLEVPSAHGSWLAAIAGLLLVSAVLTLGGATWEGNTALGRWSALTLAISIALLWISPTHYPEGITTLGDLARNVAHLNPMMLKAHGAGLRPGDIWESLRTMASEATGTSANWIQPKTPFIRQNAKKQTA